MQNRFAPLIILAIGGIAVSGLSLIIWLTVNEGNDGFAIGKISNIATSSIVVADRYEAETIVVISSTTNIYQYGEPITFETLGTSTFVQVRGKPVGQKTIDAETIILLRPPRDKNYVPED